jgi:hypothetical protein
MVTKLWSMAHVMENAISTIYRRQILNGSAVHVEMLAGNKSRLLRHCIAARAHAKQVFPIARVRGSIYRDAPSLPSNLLSIICQLFLRRLLFDKCK